MTLSQKRLAIEPDHNQISIVRQCELLGLARSSLYYTPCRDTNYNEQKGGERLAPPRLYLLKARPFVAMRDVGFDNRPGNGSLFQESAEE
jgi:hypothetical protein